MNLLPSENWNLSFSKNYLFNYELLLICKNAFFSACAPHQEDAAPKYIFCLKSPNISQSCFFLLINRCNVYSHQPEDTLVYFLLIIHQLCKKIFPIFWYSCIFIVLAMTWSTGWRGPWCLRDRIISKRSPIPPSGTIFRNKDQFHSQRKFLSLFN